MTTLAPSFDYAALSRVDRSVVEHVTVEIRDRMGRAAQNIVEIGARLLVVKERIGHGNFGPWLRAEFDWSEQAARRMMMVASQFKTLNLSDLNIAPSALYLLASPSTPDDVREQFIEAAQAGETVTHSDVKAAVMTQAEIDAQREALDAVDPLLIAHREAQEAKARRREGSESSAGADDAEVIGNDFTTAADIEIKPDRIVTVGHCEPLDSLVASGEKFACIYADPPWKFDNQRTRGSTDNHYPTMTLEEIAALPVGDLAAEDAHLHLWIVNGFFYESKAILDAWGFEFKSTFAWCKPQMGMGNYWRNSHELLVTAVRGNAKRFNDHSMMSWKTFDRGAHSAKPEAVRQFIERASPAPRLELFGRKLAEGWTVWGNQIDRGIFDTEVA